jgi:hypothetical protein
MHIHQERIKWKVEWANVHATMCRLYHKRRRWGHYKYIETAAVINLERNRLGRKLIEVARRGSARWHARSRKSLFIFFEGVIFTSLKRGKGTLTARLSHSHQTSTRSIYPAAQCQPAWHDTGMWERMSAIQPWAKLARPAVAFLIKICINQSCEGKTPPFFLTQY